ncbi:sigma factor-like helix-turn-helix DNA-binding protein [Clostridium sp. JN-9]|uniref:sigma factor-like helix-turn-helix DNA-binding protein n=1 Tax=Clostridium sp. JN-9 TaxID=2507159 RepID=UPI000FFE269A|nr:sigma factor-like helix-turn-helix DNA-binding protein [Clostridium sp. JN-9]QAT39524.1 hypothetical protein EQM05_04255 [Clostridium sp. JN-9]
MYFKYLNDFYEAAITENNPEIVLDKIDIEKAIKGLTTIETQVLYNLYVYGYNVRQTAKKLNRSIGTISKISNTALDKVVLYCLPT